MILLFCSLIFAGCKKDDKNQDKTIVYKIKVFYYEPVLSKQPPTLDQTYAAEITYTMPNGTVGKKRIAGNELINWEESHFFPGDAPEKNINLEWKTTMATSIYLIRLEVYRRGSTGGLKDGLLISRSDAYYGSLSVPINADPI